MLDILFPNQDLGLRLEQIDAGPAEISLHIATTSPQACCPLCRLPASRVHSHYQRTLLDLPLAACPLKLKLTVRRFLCRTSQCPRWIFAERLPGLSQPYAHRTSRMAQSLRDIGFALGGQAGQRLAAQLQLPVSRDTLLRLLRRTQQEPPTCSPRVLGIDDWALRKGQTYGTILVDLETGQVVDLLENREGATVAAWLEAHPGAEIISRDRASAYAEAASRAAPAARQVADRFHIIKNLGDALEELLTRLYKELSQLMAEPATVMAAAQTPLPPTPTTEVAEVTVSDEAAADEAPSSAAEVTGATIATSRHNKPRRRTVELSQARRSERRSRYEEVVRLRELGWSHRAIARHLGVSYKTIGRWLHSDGFPERQDPNSRPSKLDEYKEYLLQRWEQGCHNARQLLDELKAAGYKGGRSIVREYIATLRQEAQGDTAQRKTTKLARPGKLKWLLLRPVSELDDAEYETVRKLCRHSKEVTLAYGLITDFQELVRSRKADALANWVELALASGVEELASFARGVQRDFAAVYAGLELEWSQGAVEGNVNRLKMVKRTMFGRAKLDLLRIRVLQGR